MNEGHKFCTTVDSKIRNERFVGKYDRVESDVESETATATEQRVDSDRLKQANMTRRDLDIDVPMTLPAPDLPSYNLYIPDGKPDHEVLLTLPSDDYITLDLTSGDTRSGSQGHSAVQEQDSTDYDSNNSDCPPHLTSESSGDELWRVGKSKPLRTRRLVKFESLRLRTLILVNHLQFCQLRLTSKTPRIPIPYLSNRGVFDVRRS